MKLRILFLIIIVTTTLFPQVSFNTFLSNVAAIPAASRQASVDSFLTVVKGHGGTPVIEGSTASFLYSGSITSASISGDFNGWGSADAMTQITSTNLFYAQKTFEMNARLDYKIITNGSNWILDPLNTHYIAGGFGPNSELAMPGYIQPWEIQYKPGIAHGAQQQFSINSTNLAAAYTVNVYLPPAYQSTSTNFPAVYFQDGGEYISLGSALNVIDNLLDSNKIAPFIAVFVTPINRNDEYAGTKRTAYRAFFVNELLPLIDSKYRTIQSPAYRAVIGDSYGANISGLIAYYHSDLFGKCGMHSAAIYANNNEVITLFTSSEKLQVDIAATWGTYESTYEYMRPFRDALLSKGYHFTSSEYPEGHSWGLWRATLDNILEDFFPSTSTVVKDIAGEKVHGFLLYQNYPNPFNPSTTIQYNLPAQSYVTLKIYDVLGKEVGRLIDSYEAAGNYSVQYNTGSLASGIYYYQLRAGDFMTSRKMTLIR